MSDDQRLESTDRFPELEGQAVRVVGVVSSVPWQHMVADVPTHPHTAYVDVGEAQIVVYAREPLPRPAAGPLELRGRVLKVPGRSKRPGDDDRYVEWHLVVDGWTPLEG